MIIQILPCELENGTPARVSREAGVLQLAPSFFAHSTDQQHFILQHELGHYMLNTPDEISADRYAADRMLNDGYGMKKTFAAMNQSLHDTAENDLRRVALFNYFANKDNNENGNTMKTIQNLIYDNGTMREISYCNFEGESGYVFSNSYIPQNFNAPCAKVEENEFVNWCRYTGNPVIAVQFLPQYRLEKKAAWDNATQKQKNMKKVLDMVDSGTLSAAEGSALLAGIKGKGNALSSFFKSSGSAGGSEESGSGSSSGSGSAMIWILIVAAVIVAIVIVRKKKGKISKKK